MRTQRAIRRVGIALAIGLSANVVVGWLLDVRRLDDSPTLPRTSHAIRKRLGFSSTRIYCDAGPLSHQPESPHGGVRAHAAHR